MHSFDWKDSRESVVAVPLSVTIARAALHSFIHIPTTRRSICPKRHSSFQSAASTTMSSYPSFKRRIYGPRCVLHGLIIFLSFVSFPAYGHHPVPWSELKSHLSFPLRLFFGAVTRCQSPPTFVCYELPQPESYTRSSSPTSSDDGGSDDECDDSGSESNSNSNEDEDGRRSLDSHNAAPVERMTMEGLPPSTGDDDNRNTVVVVDDKPGAKSANTAPEPQDIPCPPSGNEEESEDAAEKMRAEKREGKKKEIVVSDVDVPQKADVHVEDVNTPAKRRTKKKRSRRHREDDCAPAYR